MSFLGNLRIDPSTGKAKVWDMHEKKYVLRHPIDVREGLQRGTFALESPEDEQKAMASTPPPPTSEILQMTLDQLRETCAMFDMNGAELNKCTTLQEARESVAGFLARKSKSNPPSDQGDDKAKTESKKG